MEVKINVSPQVKGVLDAILFVINLLKEWFVIPCICAFAGIILAVLFRKAAEKKKNIMGVLVFGIPITYLVLIYLLGGIYTYILMDSR